MQALIVVDVQHDFLPGGALPVPEGDQIIPIVNALIPKFTYVVATQDWHPADHGSFAANHPHQSPGNVIDLNGLSQVLWPIHCVQGTKGAKFAAELNQEGLHAIFPKGTEQGIDSYSGFYDNGRRKSTGLSQHLKEKGVDSVVIVGLAADYCVKYTALDARKEGFRTLLVTDATRGVNLQPEDTERAFQEMQAAGVELVSSETLLAF